MEPFTCYMDVEYNSREYLDELYSNDYENTMRALTGIKNAIIGSNKQKESILSLGILPRLMTLLTGNDVPKKIQYEAAVVLGSLAKGTEAQAQHLLNSNYIEIMLSVIMADNADKILVEKCLCALRAIYSHTITPVEALSNDPMILIKILGLASPEHSLECQICVSCILVPVCHSYNEQMILCEASAVNVVARLISIDKPMLQIPALKCLAGLCFTNRAVSNVVVQTMHEEQTIPDILTSLLSRARMIGIQLAAARCLTYIHRSGSLTANDPRIIYKTLPCLARLCSADFDHDTRATAAETLAYLAEIDSELQRLAAISNHLIISLGNLVQNKSEVSKQAAFRCYASLGANDEGIRKRIIEMDGLMEEVISGLINDCPDVRLAAVRCLHSLSRSVQQLRTTFQDHSVWRPLMALLSGTPTNELLTVVTSTICNLLLEFSPSKEPIIESGAIDMLCKLTLNEDSSLRLNGSWALMNMAFQAEKHLKIKIINSLGTTTIIKLLSDQDTRVIMKTLGLLRNLLSRPLDIDNIMSVHSEKVMEAVNLVLDAQYPAEVKEQALCIVANIGAGSEQIDYIMEDEHLLRKLTEFVNHKEQKLQEGAIFALKKIIEENDGRLAARLQRLKDLGLDAILDTYITVSCEASSTNEARALRQRLDESTS